MRNALLVVALTVLCSTNAFADPPITAVALSPDRQQLVMGSQQGIEIRAWPSMEFVRKLTTNLPHVHDLKFSPDGKTLLAAGGSPAESGRVELWDWPSSSRIRTLEPHSDLVYRVAWSPGGSQWVSCSGDGCCKTFSTDTAEQLISYEGHSAPVLSVRYLDAQHIVSVSADQTVRLWNPSNGSHLRTLDNHVGAVNDIALPSLLHIDPTNTNRSDNRPLEANDIEQIATVSEDRTLRLWQPKRGRLVRFVKLDSVPRCLTWSADTSEIYVGCNDGVVRVVDAEQMAVTRKIEGLPGRIHELVIDAATHQMLVAGANGWKMLSLDDSSE